MDHRGPDQGGSHTSEGVRMTTIQSHLRNGDYESAYRLAYIADSPNHDLIAALSLLCDAPTEEHFEDQLNAAAEEEYQRGHEDGEDEGYDEGRYDAATLADRHCRALVGVEYTFGRLRDRLRHADLPTFDTTAFDNAMLALSMVVEELDDFDEAFLEASRANR